MRRYIISYWVERNDCATDLEMEVFAVNFEDALKIFKENVRVYKRIESIIEKTK